MYASSSISELHCCHIHFPCNTLPILYYILFLRLTKTKQNDIANVLQKLKLCNNNSRMDTNPVSQAGPM